MASLTPAEQLRETVLTLQSHILSSHPQLPVLLRTIHTQLRSDPELVTTLDETAIGIIVSGLAKQQNVVIATSIAKSKTKGVKSIGLADL